MGLLLQAMKTYDKMSEMKLLGKYEEEKEPLAPVGHIITNAQIQITINKDGNFISADKMAEKIIIPVTEESSGRTSSPSAHPLCDNIGYISGEDERKYSLYIDGLSQWAESEFGDKKLDAILKYVKSKSLIADLDKAGLLKRNDDKGINNDKDNICWNVIGLGDESGEVYKDLNLMNKYSLYYQSKKKKDCSDLDICYVTGNHTVMADQHLKGVVSFNGNAKMISANDSVNYTYRGRFINAEEALSIGYEASQKAHNTLKWLVANQRVSMGNRVIICWNPNGKEIPKVDSPLLRSSHERKLIPTSYKKELQSVIMGYKKELSDSDDIIIVSFDAATSGRLSITYYNELKGSDFLDRLKTWDETCCWYSNHYGVSSPSLYDIINYTYGYQRGNEDTSKIETDSKVISQHMQRIIRCRVDQAAIPKDIVHRLVGNAGNLQIYNRSNRIRLLFTACSVIRKYKYDYWKEDWEMALDSEKRDRSYQYGRLLAILEKIEKDTYDNGENRETNAIRMQSVFVKRPAYATKIIIDQLKNSYYPKLKPSSRIYYDKMIGQIMDVISEFGDEQFNRPLTETYLLGYYLQQNRLYSKKETSDEEELENE